MLLKSIELNPFDSTHFAWIDVNLLTKTFNNSLNYIDDTVYDKINKICKEPKDKLSIQILNYWHPEYYSNLSTFFSKYQWIVSAAFFTIESEVGKEILPKFTQKAEELINKGFCQGEESIFAFIIDQYPNYFNLSVGDYEDSINNYYGFKIKKECNHHIYEDQILAKKHSYIFNIIKNYQMYRLEIFNKIRSEFKIEII
jgi:hypothetical protein